MIDRKISHQAYAIVAPTNRASIQVVEKGGLDLIAQLIDLQDLGRICIQKSTMRFLGVGSPSATSLP